MNTLFRPFCLLVILSSSLNHALPLTLDVRSPQNPPLSTESLPTPSPCFPTSFHFSPFAAVDCTDLINNYLQSPAPKKWSYALSTNDTLTLPKAGTWKQGSCFISVDTIDPAKGGTFSLSEIGEAASLLVKGCASGSGGTQSLGDTEQGYYVYLGATAPPLDFSQLWDPVSGHVNTEPTGTGTGSSYSEPTTANLGLSATIPNYKGRRTLDQINPLPTPLNISITAGKTLAPTAPSYKDRRTNDVDLEERAGQDPTLQPALAEYKDKSSSGLKDLITQPGDNDRLYLPTHQSARIEDSSLPLTVSGIKNKRRVWHYLTLAPGDRTKLKPNAKAYDPRIAGSSLQPTIPESKRKRGRIWRYSH